MDLPPLHLLRTFDVSARTGSFTAASRALGISQAAVSQQIGQLETWLGRRLFRREGRGVRLSPAGEELQEAVAAGLALIARTARQLRRDPALPGLTVACIPQVALRWLVPNLAAYHALHPSAALRLVHAQAQQTFDPNEADILITLADSEQRGTQSVPLFSRRSRPVASALLAQRRPELADPEALAGMTLLHDESTGGWARWFARAGLPQTAPPKGPVFHDPHLLATAVLAGQGVALCPVELFRPEIERGELVLLSDIEIDADNSFRIIFGTSPTPAATAFIDWFADLCRPSA